MFSPVYLFDHYHGSLFCGRYSTCCLENGQAPRVVSTTVCPRLGGPESRHYGALPVQNTEGDDEDNEGPALIQSHVCNNHFLSFVYLHYTGSHNTRDSCETEMKTINESNQPNTRP